MLLLLQLASTLPMTGLIWFIQVVHYPLFAQIGSAEAVPYARLHADRTSWVVGPPMLLELSSTLLLLRPGFRSPTISVPQAALGAALLAVIWISTALLQVPAHNRLGTRHDPATVHRLVLTNWIRTAAWTARAALVLFWTRQAFGTN